MWVLCLRYRDLVVFGAVVGGYLMEHGNIKVLLQSAELLIIGRAGAGTVWVRSPAHPEEDRGRLSGVIGGPNSPGSATWIL
jgi:chemotaxis protein MotA